MKYPFVVATIASKKKGHEHSAPPIQTHPARDLEIKNPESGGLPVKVHTIHKAPAKPKDEPLDIQKEIEKFMAKQPQAKKSVPKSRILGMANAVAEPEPLKDYADVLAMLLGKK